MMIKREGETFTEPLIAVFKAATNHLRFISPPMIYLIFLQKQEFCFLWNFVIQTILAGLAISWCVCGFQLTLSKGVLNYAPFTNLNSLYCVFEVLFDFTCAKVAVVLLFSPFFLLVYICT